MKSIKTIIKTLVVLLLVVGCAGNEYDTPESFTDLSFTTTFGASTLREGEVNRFISFMDLSAGATHHEWRIPKGAFFLKGPIPNNLPSHDQFIMNPGDTVSTDKTVHVLFKKGDSNTVIELYNEFADSTSFIVPSYWDTVGNQTINDTIRTSKVGDKWVATYQVTLDVYDTIVPTMEIYDINENKIDYDAVDTIYLDFGDQLIFKDLSGLLPDNNARPNATAFRVATIEENEEDEIRVHNDITRYNAEDFGLGTTNVDTINFNKTIGNFYGFLESQRERTETLRAHEARFDIPVVFKVSPLAEDLVPKASATEADDNSIVITLSSRVRTIESSVHPNFTVTIDGTPTDILSVLSARNGNDLVVNLVTPLEPSDASKTVELSYDGLNEEIVSLDERPLLAFTESVAVYVPTPVDQTGDVVSDSENSKVLVKFDQDIDAATLTGATDATDGFTVTLNSTPATISAITVNATDASVLELTIAEGVYHDDTITVEFSGAATSEIRSVGEGALNAFGAKTVVHNLTNLLIDGSFEGTFGENWKGGASGAGAVVEFSADQARTGSQSVKLKNDKPRLETTAANVFDYEDGATYKISYWRYIPTAVDFDSGNFRGGDAGEKIWYRLGPGNESITPRWFATGDPVKDTWELVEVEYNPLATTGGGIRFQPVPTSGTEYTYYIDDMSIVKVNKRP